MSAEKLILIIILAGGVLAWTTTIDSKTEYGYLRCKSNLDCKIQPKPKPKPKPVPKAKPKKHKEGVTI